MSSFLNQKLGQTFGQTVQSLGQQSNVELRVGSHTLLVKERVAEGKINDINNIFLFFNITTNKGGFGFVDLVTEVHTKKDYVLKRCNVDREAAFATVKKEINILQRFAGPYMVELIDSDIITKNRTSREALLLLDFCPGGHLLERLNSRNGNPLPAESVFRIFGQLLLAMKPLHENRPPVVHRDLKLENILFGAVS
jgi:serine/threonine protein kinase